MRSVDRGVNTTVYANYGDALVDLMRVLGDYCSYCEISINNLAAVEHVIPQAHAAALRVSWSNFLIACTYCNSTKSNRNPARAGYIWPDTVKTLPLVEYLYYFVLPANHLTGISLLEVNNTIDLMGLDKVPGHINFNLNDRRWIKRFEAYEKADRQSNVYNRHRFQQDYIDLIVDLATATGFFSIWYKAFASFPEVQQELVNAFPGTDI